jgi:hypothetical protein
MTNQIEQREGVSANHCLHLCRVHAQANCPNDVEAATAAILIRALELATPELSPEKRASLFLSNDE